MTPDYIEAVSSWLLKAKSDLAASRVLIEREEPLNDTGVYHCQQAAEKALKGWLTSRRVEVRKTHDLVELLNECVRLQPSFALFDEAMKNLAPFATQFRYPGDILEPPNEEAIKALFDAANVVGFVVADLKAAHPGAFGVL